MKGKVTDKSPRLKIIHSAIFFSSFNFSPQMLGSRMTITRISVAIFKAPAAIKATFRLLHIPPGIFVSQFNTNRQQSNKASRIILTTYTQMTPVKIQI